MKINNFERFFVNSPVRRFVQKYWEVPTLIRLGGYPCKGSIAEIGFGSGYGLKLIREKFQARVVHGFEIDETTIKKASSFLAKEIMAKEIQLHEDDDELTMLRKNSYGSIFFFGSLHHIPKWQQAVHAAVASLNEGGKIYFWEFYKPCIDNYVVKKFLDHPHETSFTHEELKAELEKADCKIIGEKNILNLAGMLVVERQKEVI
tara:strand:- start:54801 stop:55412 length:612 start_codon:yes stop_codon:yes gene_type:complete